MRSNLCMSATADRFAPEGRARHQATQSREYFGFCFWVERMEGQEAIDEREGDGGVVTGTERENMHSVPPRSLMLDVDCSPDLNRRLWI